MFLESHLGHDFNPWEDSSGGVSNGKTAIFCMVLIIASPRSARCILLHDDGMILPLSAIFRNGNIFLNVNIAGVAYCQGGTTLPRRLLFQQAAQHPRRFFMNVEALGQQVGCRLIVGVVDD